MNKIILMGRLTKNPEVSHSTSGNAFARYDLAVDRKFKKEGEPEADFFSLVSFGKQAEFVEKYLQKGTKIVISGRLQNNNYTNKEGQKVYGVQIITEEVEFAESKKNNDTSTQDADFLSVPEGLVEELPFS